MERKPFADVERIRQVAIRVESAFAPGVVRVVDASLQDRGPEETEAVKALGMQHLLPLEPMVRVRLALPWREVPLDVPPETTSVHAAAYFAETLQELLIEKLPEAVARCPDHPHAMLAETSEVMAWWACPHERATVAKVIYEKS